MKSYQESLYNVMRNQSRPEKVFMALFFVAFLFQELYVYKAGENSSPLRAYHVLLPFFPLLIPFRFKDVIYTDVSSVFILVLTGFSISGVLSYGYMGGLPLLLMLCLSYVCGRVVYCRFGLEQILSFLEVPTAIFLVALVIRDVLTIGTLVHLATAEDRIAIATYPFITSGGPNIESTILAMLAGLFIRRNIVKYIIPMAIFSSICFQSRTGLACILFVTLLYFIDKRRQTIKKDIMFLMCVMSVALVILAALPTKGSGVLERLGDVGGEVHAQDEKGRATGRSLLWGTAALLLLNNPLGYGSGGGVEYAKDEMGVAFRENNFHNIVLQYTVDGGFFSGASFILVLINTSVICIRRKFENPLDIAVFIYIMTGLIQWSGYDPFGWFFIGIFSAMNRDLALRKWKSRYVECP